MAKVGSRKPVLTGVATLTRSLLNTEAVVPAVPAVSGVPVKSSLLAAR